ncbi:unnamed protein product [Closterium sp. Yama58-4]|nr:unnamed protein product [Closterium sp. Yama58-4]
MAPCRRHRNNSAIAFRSSQLAVAATIRSRSALASRRRSLRAPPALAVGALHSLALVYLVLLAVSPLASARSLDNAPPAAAPPPPPPSGGYDYTCLWKDVSKTNCSDKSIGPWGILTFIVLVVAALLIISTPFFIIYRQTQRGSRKLRICCCGRKYPEYAEAEARAAANSTDMPRPPEVSKFRSMSTSSSTDKT